MDKLSKLLTSRTKRIIIAAGVLAAAILGKNFNVFFLEWLPDFLDLIAAEETGAAENGEAA